MVFTTNYERLAAQIVEDTAVLVRALVLPKGGGAEAFGARPVRWITRGWICGGDRDSVWLGRKWSGWTGRRRWRSCSRRSPAARRCVSGWIRRETFRCAAGRAGEVGAGKNSKAAVEQICGSDAIEKLAG
jgi:hypothetical protein